MKFLKIIGTTLLGAVAGWCVYYVIWVFMPGIARRGEQLESLIFGKGDPLASGLMIAVCLVIAGAAAGLIIGVIRATKRA